MFQASQIILLVQKSEQLRAPTDNKWHGATHESMLCISGVALVT